MAGRGGRGCAQGHHRGREEVVHQVAQRGFDLGEACGVVAVLLQVNDTAHVSALACC